MTEEKKFFTSLTLSANCSTEEIDLINQTFEEVTGFNDSVTFRKYLFTLLAKATANVRPNISKKEDIEKINALHNELTDDKIKYLEIIKVKDLKIDELLLDIENLKIALTDALESDSEKIKQKNIRIEELSIENDTLNQTIVQLSSKEPEKIEVPIPVKLTDSQNIINLTPMEKYFMDTVCHNESKRSKKPINAETILKDIFNRYIAYGPCDFFPRPFTDSELKELHTKFNLKQV